LDLSKTSFTESTAGIFSQLVAATALEPLDPLDTYENIRFHNRHSTETEKTFAHSPSSNQIKTLVSFVVFYDFFHKLFGIGSVD
jgi:hypothetical protein